MIKRPALYVGTYSFSRIVIFISGWMKAIKDFRLKETEEEQKFRRFQKYIEEKGLALPSPSWDKIIWYWTMADDEAFKKFFEWLDEFAFQEKGFVENIEFHWKLRNGWEITDLIDFES